MIYLDLKNTQKKTSILEVIEISPLDFYAIEKMLFVPSIS